MLYVLEVTIPANTTRSNPLSVTLSVTAGKVTEIEILFPPKHGAFVGARIKDFEHVIFPTNPDEWIIADGVNVDWEENYDIQGAPFTLTFEAFNTDDTFEHTLYFRVVMLEAEKVGVMDKLAAWLKGW